MEQFKWFNKIFLVQVILLVACFRQSIPAKIEEVNTRWTYRDGKGNNTKSLPDLIQIALEFEDGKLTMNLMKFPLESPLIMSQFEGSRSVWEPSKDERLVGIYKDLSVDASATVAIKKVGEIEEILYTISFSYANKSYSVEPGVNFSDKPSFEKFGGVTIERENHRSNYTRLLIIDRKLHSLLEIPKVKFRQDVHLDKDQLKKFIKETRLKKRSTRISERLLTIEMFTVIDYTIFNKYFAESKASSVNEKKEDARKTIKYFFTHIMEEMKMNFESIKSILFKDPVVKFTVKWAGALIAESPSDVPFIEVSKIDSHSIDSDMVFDEMAKWESNEKSKTNESRLPNYDFVTLFTSYHIKYHGEHVYGVQRNKICTPSSSALVHYAHLHYTANVASHELGHAFNIRHDGLGGDCLENYIMEPGFADYSKDNVNNAFQFSTCSVIWLSSKLMQLDKSGTNCLTDGGETVKDNPESVLFLDLYPGQLYDLDDQCKIVFGPNSFYCGGSENDQDMCEVIRCHRDNTCIGHFLLNAMDGTTCSNGSWCRRGRCVSNRRAPKAPKTCVSGDSKLPLIHNSEKVMCEDLIDQNPSMCNDKEIKNICCASCDGNRTKNGGCQDTVDECTRLEPRDCYISYYATTCCKTCRDFILNPSEANCLYGDMDSRCSLMVPSVCHLNSRFCCKTCAAYHQSAKTTTEGFAYPITTNVPSSSHMTITNITSVTSETAILSITSTTTANPTSSALKEIISLPSTVHVLTTAIDSKTTSSTKPNDSCAHGDFRGVLEFVSFWQDHKNFRCEELVKYNPYLCHYEAVQKYCCASCSSKEVKDFCKHDDATVRWSYAEKYFTCKEIVEYDPNVCKYEHVIQRCCHSCGSFTIRALEE